MNHAGIQGQLGKIIITAVAITILAVIIYFLVVGFFIPPVSSSYSVHYIISNPDPYRGKNITVQGFYENGVITDVQTNSTYQVNNWDPSMVFLPVNTTHVPVALYANRSYYFSGHLETINSTRIYPLSTVQLNVTSVKPV